MLNVLAEASIAVTDAEAALGECAFQTATERLDSADAALADLRAAWPEMTMAIRAVVGPGAADLKRRIETARPRIPRMTSLTVGTAESDPDEEQEPAD